MDQFSIKCTPEQTQKALELGAPIMSYYGYSEPQLPTAEQMIGWLESVSTIQLLIEKQMVESGTHYRIWVRDECKPFSDIIAMHNYLSRKEATLAAIDAALDFLINKK